MTQRLGTVGELASLYGVETSFKGGQGDQHADEDTVLAILRALGAPIAGAADAPEAVRARYRASAERVMEPVAVHRPGRRVPLHVTLPGAVEPAQVWCTLEREEGGVRHERMVPAVSAMTRLADGASAGLRRYTLDPGRWDGTIPPGYHTLTVEAPGLPSGPTASTMLVSAPPCPAAERGWGLFMPLHALRSADDWGTGSYGDLAGLCAWVAELGGTMVGCLPLYPSFWDPPVDPSPYRPASRLAYNDLYIDPVGLPELAHCPEAKALLGDETFAARIERARKSPLVEYEEVAHLRWQVLEPMARTLLATPSSRRDELVAFGRAHPELVGYARFMAVRQLGGAGPPGVPPGGPFDGGDADVPGAGYHLYCQWAAAQQLSAAGDVLGLYADLPVGVHPEGFDMEQFPTSFVPRVHGGAPPDSFFAGGQDWGFRPLHPEQIRHDRYRYVIASLRRAFRHACCLRVDHIMGLQRLYLIPEGADARHGAYVSYRAEELHALVSLEAHRAGAVVVGEDLGTVPEGVHQRMAEDRMLRSWVFQFESTPARPLPDPPRAALSSLGTHDLPRFATFLWGLDIEERAERGELAPLPASAQMAGRERWRRSLLDELGVTEEPGTDTTARAHAGCLSHLAGSAADLVLVDLEELWGERLPQNRPGTGTEAGNWRRRGALTLEEARVDADVGATLALVAQLRKEGTP